MHTQDDAANLAMAGRAARAMKQFETGDFIEITDELTELTAEEFNDFLDQVAEMLAEREDKSP